MVDSIVSHSQPTAIDGVTPVDLPACPESDFTEFNSYADKLDQMLLGLESIGKLDHFVQDNMTNPNKELVDYAVTKYGIDVVSNEDINETSRQVWERTKMALKRANSDLYGYAKVLMAGTDRLVERLGMLYEMASNLGTTKPYIEEIEFRSYKKFGINGVFAPTDIRPVLEQTQNVIDFYDKVFLPYLTAIDKTFNNLSFDKEWTEDSTINFNVFYAKRWLKGAIEVEEDSRFRISSTLFRSGITQGDKAIYFSGPTEAETDKIEDWAFLVNTIRDFRFKYYTVPEQKPMNEADNKLKVSPVNTVRQRLGVLLGLAKRIQSRKGYDQKLAGQLRKVEQSAERIRTKAGQVREQQGANKPGEENRAEAQPAVSNVVNDVTTILNNVMRMVVDYNNALAGMIRLIAAQAMVADKELEAYQAPIRKPTTEEVARQQ